MYVEWIFHNSCGTSEVTGYRYPALSDYLRALSILRGSVHFEGLLEMSNLYGFERFQLLEALKKMGV